MDSEQPGYDREKLATVNRGAVQSYPRPGLESLEDALGVEFYELLPKGEGRSLIGDYEWVLEHVGRYKVLASRWKRLGVSGDREGVLGSIRNLLLMAPSARAVEFLQQCSENKDVFLKFVAAVGKTDDDDEVAARERNGRRTFGVIERLVEVGGPLPPWLTPWGDLEDG